ncbi:MAG: endonuclease III [Anaerolineae bacterium]|nr:endonuclease III [Anaerolineae bacterium]
MEVCRAPERPEMDQAQFDALRTKTLEVHNRLVRVFGTPSRTGHLDPVSELVSAILSQNTSDVNRDRAYRRLRARLPTWEAVRDADVREVREAIRPAGLSEIKAPRIQEALRRITQPDGHPSLGFLRHMNVEEARNWLMGIKGVGPKTAAIILLFSMGRPAFPVDTHIHRVTKRLALIGPRASREQAHDILERLVPPELYYPFHINVIRHGREVCRPQPRCEVCVLRDLCCYYAACVQGTATGEEKAAVCETGP